MSIRRGATRSLRPSGVELLWIVDIYGFVLAGSLITMGTAEAARQAFGYGLHVAFAISAAVTLVAAVAAVTLLRHRRVSD